MMGSGKTSVGEALSQRTGWPYLDNDGLVQAASGRTARELAADVEELRRYEIQALLDGLRSDPPVIIGAAGGVVLDPTVRHAIGDAFVVWLRASPTTLASRAVGAAHRPWLEGDALAWMEAAAGVRAPAYRALASMAVDTDARSPDEVAEAILRRLASDVGTAAAADDRHTLEGPSA